MTLLWKRNLASPSSFFVLVGVIVEVQNRTLRYPKCFAIHELRKWQSISKLDLSK